MNIAEYKAIPITIKLLHVCTSLLNSLYLKHFVSISSGWFHLVNIYCHRYHTGQQSLITQEIKDESSGYFYLFFLLMLGYID